MAVMSLIRGKTFCYARSILEASLFATLGFTGRRGSNEDLLLLKEMLLRFSNVLYV